MSICRIGHFRPLLNGSVSIDQMNGCRWRWQWTSVSSTSIHVHYICLHTDTFQMLTTTATESKLRKYRKLELEIEIFIFIIVSAIFSNRFEYCWCYFFLHAPFTNRKANRAFKSSQFFNLSIEIKLWFSHWLFAQTGATEQKERSINWICNWHVTPNMWTKRVVIDRQVNVYVSGTFMFIRSLHLNCESWSPLNRI